MNYLLVVGVFQALLVSFLLWGSRTRAKADDLLVALLICIALHLSIKLVIFTVVQDDHVRNRMNTFIGLCYGPLLYLYALKKKDASFVTWTRWYYFLPFFAGTVAYLLLAILLLKSPTSAYGYLNWYNTFSFFGMTGLEMFFFFKVNSIARKIDTEDREKRLLLRLSRIFLAITGMGILFMGIDVLFHPSHMLVRMIIYSMLVWASLEILWHKYRVPVQSAAQPPVAIITDGGDNERKANTPDKLVMAAHFTRIDSEIQQKKFYLNSDLTLEELAKQTGTSRHGLSELLNHYAGKTFYQYINEYRVEAVKKQIEELVQKDASINLLSLAYDCGFKAKSSFNLYFKKETGSTPSEYVQSILRKKELA